MSGFFSSAIISFVNIVIQAISMVVISAVCVKQLDPESAATWFLISGMVPFLNVFDFGFSGYLAREIGFVHAKKNRHYRIQNLFKSITFFLTAVLVTAGALLSLMSLGLWASGRWSEIVLQAVLIFGFGALLKVYSNVVAAVLYGHALVSFERLIRSFSTLVFLIASVVFIAFEKDVRVLSGAWFLHSVVHLGLAYYLIHCHKLLRFRQGRFVWALLRRAWIPCINWVATTIPAQFIMNFNIYLVGIFLTPEDVVRYGVLNTIVQGVLSLASIPSIINIPRFSRLFGQKAAGVLKNEVLLNTTLVSFIAISVSCVIAIHSDLMWSFWLGKENFVEAGILVLMLIFCCLEAPQVSLTGAAMATGYTHFAVIAFFSGIFMLSFSSFLLPRWGLIGLPVSLILAQGLTCDIFNVRVAKKIFSITMIDGLTWLLKALLVFAVFTGVNIFLHRAMSGIEIHSLVRLLAVAWVNILVFGMGVYFIKKENLRENP